MGVYIKYSSYSGRVYTQLIAWWSYLGKQGSYNAADTNKSGCIRCIECCGNSWTESGYSINAYECDCCGAQVTTEPVNVGK